MSLFARPLDVIARRLDFVACPLPIPPPKAGEGMHRVCGAEVLQPQTDTLELRDPLFGSIGNNGLLLPAVVFCPAAWVQASDPGVVADGGRPRHIRRAHIQRAVDPLLERAQ